MNMDLWDVFHQYQGCDVSSNNEALSNKLDTTKDSIQNGIDHVDERVSHLALLCRAMFELIQERTDISNEDLAKKMEEVDLRDGHADGKISTVVKKCSQCGRTISPKFNRCLYCGHQEGNADPFNAI